MRPPSTFHDGPETDHFDGARFFNPAGPSHPSVIQSLAWLATRRPKRWDPAPPFAPATPAPRVDDLRVTMVGHGSVLVQAAGRNVLLDPVWEERVGPRLLGAVRGPRRRHPPGIRFADLPPIDLVLISHAHWDHACVPTLERLRDAHAPRIVAPLGLDVALRRETDLAVETLDWHETRDGITATPCRHWSQRWGWDKDLSLWACFVLETPVGALFLMGDTGWDEGRPYRNLPARPRLATIPIGAYAPRWHNRHEHQAPDQAAEGFRLCGARHAVATHWGCFKLTDEGRTDPPEALAEALSEEERARFRVLAPGEAWDVPA